MPTDLRNIQTADVANRTIVPYRVGGALRVGKQDVPLNRAYQRFGISNNMQQFANRYMNKGGTSPMFGANEKIASGRLPELPPDLIPTIEEVFARFTDPITTVQRDAVFRFLFMNILAGNWERIDEYYCHPLGDVNGKIGWVADPGGTGLFATIDGLHFANNSNVFQTATNSVDYGGDVNDAFIGMHIGKQAISTSGNGGVLIGTSRLLIESTGAGNPVGLQISMAFKSTTNSLLSRYSSYYASRRDAFVDMYFNGQPDGSGKDITQDSPFSNTDAQIRLTSNNGNIYGLSGTWGRSKGFNFQTWHDEEVIMYTALGAYSSPAPAEGEFLSTNSNGGNVRLTGVSNLAMLSAGDIIVVNSDDGFFINEAMVINSIANTNVNTNTGYVQDTGSGTYLENLQPTP